MPKRTDTNNKKHFKKSLSFTGQRQIGKNKSEHINDQELNTTEEMLKILGPDSPTTRDSSDSIYNKKYNEINTDQKQDQYNNRSNFLLNPQSNIYKQMDPMMSQMQQMPSMMDPMMQQMPQMQQMPSMANPYTQQMPPMMDSMMPQMMGKINNSQNMDYGAVDSILANTLAPINMNNNMMYNNMNNNNMLDNINMNNNMTNNNMMNNNILSNNMGNSMESSSDKVDFKKLSELYSMNIIKQ